jgi:sulfite exporter TauE/SafE
MGLHLAGLPVLSHWLERVGVRAWKLIEPVARASLRGHGLGAAFLAGAAWGWIPCGLVYSALTAALFSGSAPAGAAIALAFGLGTLPALSALGWAAQRGMARMQTPRLLRIAGVLIVIWGVAGLLHLDPLAHLQQFGEACMTRFR